MRAQTPGHCHRSFFFGLVLALVLLVGTLAAGPVATAHAQTERASAALRTTPGSILIFSAKRRDEAPVPLGYGARPKAINSPLLFTQVRIKRSGEGDAGQLEVEEKAVTIDTKGAARPKVSSPAKGKLAP